ncbi:tryptophan--tRNA ligase [Candidatus Shapirobacteria bacterium]|nr:tryptophan--tRNA ligase [Candidatus Shapirobacteria bacterium]
MNKRKRTFSGIQPTGSLHIGNYIGTIKQWVEMQKDHQCIYCVVDLHAITVPKKPEVLKERIREVAALFIACGVDPEKSIIFIQSHNPDHSVLSWIMDCTASMGQLERMTQYKSKSEKQKGFVSVGLFNYPALMAADILLYQTDVVPVGDDQKQHVELTRDLAQRFNSRYGEVFTEPEVSLQKVGARVMSLQDPSAKMSKSDEDPNGTIDLLDSLEEVKKKIMSAVTDSGKEIVFKKEKLAISNLLGIYSQLGNISIEELEKKYQGKGYGEFKKDLVEAVVEFLKPIQKKYYRIMKNQEGLEKILKQGGEKARAISQKTLAEVYKVMGLG